VWVLNSVRQPASFQALQKLRRLVRDIAAGVEGCMKKAHSPFGAPCETPASLPAQGSPGPSEGPGRTEASSCRTCQNPHHAGGEAGSSGKHRGEEEGEENRRKEPLARGIAPIMTPLACKSISRSDLVSKEGGVAPPPTRLRPRAPTLSMRKFPEAHGSSTPSPIAGAGGRSRGGPSHLFGSREVGPLISASCFWADLPSQRRLGAWRMNVSGRAGRGRGALL
jgi:hypothetical protein